jgi:hypothetical protein
MSKRAQAGVVAIVVVGLATFWIWRAFGTPAEREIRQRLHGLAAEFNEATTDGLGTVARAARIGQFFTPDVVVELGQGSPPIHGRETLMGMAARLQPRTAAFEVELSDLNVALHGDDRAEVALTMVIRRRSMTSGDESLDAREFSTELQRLDGDWRISRVVAIDTLR